LANLVPGGGTPSSTSNKIALRHGGYAEISREALDEQERRVLDAISDDAPLRDPDGALPRADGVMVRVLASALVRLDRVESYHRDHGWLDGKGEPRPSAHLERLLRAEIADHCDALGMSPRSRARLGLDLQRGYDLAQAMSDPDPEERRRLMVDAGIEEDDA
jgi:hypothetical protein